MTKEKLPVTNMLGLLQLLSHGEYGSRKVRATLHRSRDTPRKPYVEEIFDDGKGHSNAITKERTPVTQELFLRAVNECYVNGALEPGYVSQTEYLLSRFGRDVYMDKLLLMKLVREDLHQMNAMRACDLQPRLDVPEDDVTEILDWLVASGEAEQYEQQGQKFYLLTQFKAA